MEDIQKQGNRKVSSLLGDKWDEHFRKLMDSGDFPKFCDRYGFHPTGEDRVCISCGKDFKE